MTRNIPHLHYINFRVPVRVWAVTGRKRMQLESLGSGHEVREGWDNIHVCCPGGGKSKSPVWILILMSNVDASLNRRIHKTSKQRCHGESMAWMIRKGHLPLTIDCSTDCRSSHNSYIAVALHEALNMLCDECQLASPTRLVTTENKR